MISTDEAAQLVQTTRVTINACIAKGRAIGLTQTKRGLKLPAWQFEPRVWDALPALSRALGTCEGWALLAYVETPLGALDGRTPRQAIAARTGSLSNDSPTKSATSGSGRSSGGRLRR